MFAAYDCHYDYFTEPELWQVLRKFNMAHLGRISKVKVSPTIESSEFIPFFMAERSRLFNPDGKTYLCHWFCQIFLNDCVAQDLNIIPVMVEDYCGPHTQVACVIMRDALQVELHFFINQTGGKNTFPEGDKPPVWLAKCIEALVENDEHPRPQVDRICAAVKAYMAYAKSGSNAV